MGAARRFLESAHCTRILLAAALSAFALLAACSEREQTEARSNVYSEAWQGAEDPFVVPGWNPGDKASWERQMAHRAQLQNEYNRVH